MFIELTIFFNLIKIENLKIYDIFTYLMDDIYNETVKGEINVFNSSNEIYFNGPIDRLSMNKLVEELLKMEN